MPSFMNAMVSTLTARRDCENVRPYSTGRSSSLAKDKAAKRAKRLAHAAVAAADITQEALAEMLGVSASYVRQVLSPLEEHRYHDFKARDIALMPEAARRVYRDDINEDLGEESRPIVDAGDGALLKAVVAGLRDAAFLLRAAQDEELLDEEDETEVRDNAIELMTLLGALVHKRGSAKGREGR